jgi:NAD(P)-dependent dehydrogenase (short-subunit alcohol dehydrogenase family)
MLSSLVEAKAKLMQQSDGLVKMLSVFRVTYLISQILIGCTRWSSSRKAELIFSLPNAGILEFAPLGSITESHIDKSFDINVRGLLFTVQKALPLFHDGGSIILTASVNASKEFEATNIYSATKAAIRSSASCWTVDLKPRKIRVNAISPGPIDTPMTRSMVEGDSGEQLKKNLLSTMPLGRMGNPDEIAKAVSFLASDDSSFVTGTELFVDGGQAQI